ncbi:MAG: trigger factor [Patescibacteria group bacterium]
MHKIKSLEKKEGSVIEIAVEFPAESVEAKWQKALKAVGENARIDGFRKGHIPEKVLVEKAGEMTILEEASRLAIDEAFSLIVIENNLKIIGHPNIVITKIAIGEPLEVTIRVTVVPEIKLPDYAKIAGQIMKAQALESVTDEEVEKVIEDLKKGRKEMNEPDVIDDEFVQKLGKFENVEQFKIKLKENIGIEKEYKAREKSRIETLEAIRKDSNIDVPQILLDNELDRMMGEFSHKLSQMGRSLEEYKKDAGKSEDQIREEWKVLAKDRTQNELILLEIARIEKIMPKKEDIDHEVHHMEEQYPASPRERIEAFVEEVLTKEEVFKFLESKGK